MASAAQDDLLQQARRLRFTDAAFERRFRDERQTEGLLRSRVTAVVALFYVAVIGWWQVQRIANFGPVFLEWALHYRFLVVVPMWLLLLVSTGLPGHLRRAEWVYAGATVGALWGLVLMGMGPRTAASALTVDFAMVLLTSVIVLPMCCAALVTTAVAGTAGAIAWVLAVAPAGSTLAGAVTINFTLAALVAVAVGWGREHNDRTLFAQREQVRQLAERLEANNAELARLNAEKSEFMAVAAHDLRAPLGVVRGLLELVGQGKLDTEEKRVGAVRQALGEAERMHRLVDDYLGAHALESGAVAVRWERVDLGVVAQAAGARHAGAAAKKGQLLEVETPVGRVWVRADAGMLAQIADNFVTNALKFSTRGAVVRVELLVAEAEGGGGVARLTVTDEGPGIAGQEQGKLFTKFGKGSARATAGEASTGLGLAVAKRLAEAMGGSVGCESPANERGTGARFWVEVALAEAGEG